MYILTYILNQGYGYMSLSDYHSLPVNVRGRVEVLAVCETEAKARRIHRHLPKGWDDKLLAYRGDAPAVEVIVVQGGK